MIVIVAPYSHQGRAFVASNRLAGDYRIVTHQSIDRIRGLDYDALVFIAQDARTEKRGNA